jgi:hypothetical protein
VLGDLGRAERRAGRLDHDAQAIGEGHARLGPHGGGDGVHARFDDLDLAARRDERNHDLGHDALCARGRLEDGTGLHVVDLRDREARRTPRIPSMGLYSRRLDPRLDVRQRQGEPLGEVAHPLAVGGRNSWRGGSKSRMHTGWPP